MLIDLALTVAGNHGDYDGGAGGGALDEDGEEDADHEADDRVGEKTVALEYAACIWRQKGCRWRIRNA